MPWDVSLVASFLWGLVEWKFSMGGNQEETPSS